MEDLTNQQEQNMNFEQLAQSIQQLDSTLRDSAVKAINRMTTMRNWLIGAYIVEYEQNGVDRASYGTKLLKNLEEKINRRGLTVTTFQAARLVYRMYPQIGSAIRTKYSSLTNILPAPTIYPSLTNKFSTEAEMLLSHLSFTHLRELIAIEDPLVRYFYELECIKNTWSVRELRRQIVTNLHVRIGLTQDKLALMSKVNETAEKNSAALQIREPYTFEFLGLRPEDIGEESDLEDTLIKHLEEFLLELGKGFCFEARQKRILIDDEYYFADLVFYNRLLHCSVIIEVKNDEFRHENLGQLNAYVGYYAENEMQPGDNPPVGILLCTKKGKKMVEYALGAMDRQLFVSTYQLQLPNRKEWEDFIEQQRKEGFQ